MNKNILIFGGVALLGVVAFLYFKPKLKSLKEKATALGTETIGETSTPAGTVLTTPQEVEAIAVKISTARDLTKTICDLKKQYNITQDEISGFLNFGSLTSSVINSSLGGSPNTGSNVLNIAQANALRARKRNEAINTIVESIKQLKELGYKEENCKTVKIA